MANKGTKEQMSGYFSELVVCYFDVPHKTKFRVDHTMIFEARYKYT